MDDAEKDLFDTTSSMLYDADIDPGDALVIVLEAAAKFAREEGLVSKMAQFGDLAEDAWRGHRGDEDEEEDDEDEEGDFEGDDEDFPDDDE